MDSEELVANAVGTIRGTTLRADHDGYVLPGVIEWKFDAPLIDYLEDGEQPHFTRYGTGRVFKLHGDIVTTVAPDAPFDLHKIVKYEDIQSSVGFVSSKEHLLVITDHRILVLILKDGTTTDISFRFSDPLVTALSSNRPEPPTVLTETSVNVQFSTWIHPQERSSAVGYLRSNAEIPFRRPQSKSQNKGGNATAVSARTAASDTNIELSTIESLTPTAFEAFIADVKRAQGYDCTLTKESRDGGVDIIATDGRERILIQAKRYTNSKIGVAVIQRMAGLLVDSEFDGSEVEIVTTGGFTADAQTRASNIDDLTLIGGDELRNQAESNGIELTMFDAAYEWTSSPTAVKCIIKETEPTTTEAVVTAIEAPEATIIDCLETLLEKDEIASKSLDADRTIWYIE